MTESIAELQEEFRKFARDHGKGTLSGDYKLANRSYNNLMRTLRKLRSYGFAGETALLELTKENDESIVCFSATHSLHFDEKKALAALKSVAEKPGILGFDAQMVLEQWSKGELKLPS